MFFENWCNGELSKIGHQKMSITKKVLLNWYIFFNEKKIEKESCDFWHRKLTLKSQILTIWSTWRYVYSQNSAISLRPIHFIAKIKLILLPRVRNSITYLLTSSGHWSGTPHKRVGYPNYARAPEPRGISCILPGLQQFYDNNQPHGVCTFEGWVLFAPPETVLHKIDLVQFPPPWFDDFWKVLLHQTKSKEKPIVHLSTS